MKIIYFICFSFMISISCNRVDKTKATEALIINKSKFEKSLIDHFPDELGFCQEYKIISDENVLKNNIGLLIYCYNVNERYMDSLNIYYANQSLVKYTNSDSCLLVVNRFENLETMNKGEKVYLDYETRKNQNKECFYNRLPIPKFLNYQNINLNKDTNLPDGFVYYVLEAKPQKISRKYDLIPNPQMPTTWENGFSKGIAINKNKREVIFWGIMW